VKTAFRVQASIAASFIAIHSYGYAGNSSSGRETQERETVALNCSETAIGGDTSDMTVPTHSALSFGFGPAILHQLESNPFTGADGSNAHGGEAFAEVLISDDVGVILESGYLEYPLKSHNPGYTSHSVVPINFGLRYHIGEATLSGFVGAKLGVQIDIYKEKLFFVFVPIELSTVETEFAAYCEGGLDFNIGRAISLEAVGSYHVVIVNQLPMTIVGAALVVRYHLPG